MFNKKLRALCTSKPSLAEVCRGVPISRSQLNRYLNGSMNPSLNNKLKISLYFGIPAEWFDLGLDAFIKQIQDAAHSEGTIGRDLYSLIDNKARSEIFSPFLGLYHEYRFVEKPNTILKSLVHIHRSNNTIHLTNLVRFRPRISSPLRRYRYDGYMICLGDRMFSFCYDYDSSRNATSRLLYPPDSKHFKYLSGAQLSMCPTEQRHITSSRIVWEKIAPLSNLREKIRECGQMDFSSPDLNECIKRRLLNRQEKSAPVFNSYPPTAE